MTVAKTNNFRLSMAFRKAPLSYRFHKSYVKKAGPLKDDCWIWIGTPTNTGNPDYSYGSIALNKKRLQAHRVSWELANNRKVPKGMFVCHKCDVPKCVNPSHLFLGTPMNNMEDRDVKGRAAVGKNHGQYVHGKYVNQSRWRTRPNGSKYFYSGNTEKVG